MKSLLGILVLDRPIAFEKCIKQLLKSNEREDWTIVVVDNGSNEQTKEVIKKYEDDVDMVIHHDWNIGYCFGVNSWLSMREEEQTCIQIDQDLIMHSMDWWEITKTILQDPDIGMVAARRPSAWIDRPDKREGYKNLTFEERHGYWLEIPRDNCLIAPILIYKGNLLDQIGYENEASGWGDMESYYRVRALGLKSVYIPDIFLYQLANDTEVNHPQRGAHNALLQKTTLIHQKMVQQYLQGKSLFCGTRFLPLTMMNGEYKQHSDENWNFHRDWRKI